MIILLLWLLISGWRLTSFGTVKQRSITRASRVNVNMVCGNVITLNIFTKLNGFK